jgi:fatty-acyl-CoA synthase
MIRPDVMQAFVDASPTPASRPALLPSYGLAEATLAVSLMPPGEGIRLELVEESELSAPAAPRDQERPRRYRAIVNCGKPVSGMEVEIRGADGAILPTADRQGVRPRRQRHARLFPRRGIDRACLSADGWLDTGDMGYMSGGYIFIVGRAKDMIIINGRNHWPQDIEWAVEQLPGFKSGDIAAFAITGPSGEETPRCWSIAACPTQASAAACATTSASGSARSPASRPVVELVPPRTLPRTSSGKLSRTKARNLYLSGEIQPYDIAA